MRFAVDDPKLLPTPVYIRLKGYGKAQGLDPMFGDALEGSDAVAVVGTPRTDDFDGGDRQTDGADEQDEAQQGTTPTSTSYPVPEEANGGDVVSTDPAEVNPTASRLDPEEVPPLPGDEAFPMLVSAICADGARLTRPAAFTALTQTGRVTAVSIVGPNAEKLLDLLEGFIPDTKGGWASVPSGFETIEAPFVLVPGATVD